jgi:hypothetical protein
MTFPWEQPKSELNKLGPLDLAEDKNGIPFFLKRIKRLNGTVGIGWDALRAHQMDVHGIMHGQSLSPGKQTPIERTPVWPFDGNP